MKNPIKHGVMALLVSSALLAGRPAEAQVRPGTPGVKAVGANLGPTISVTFDGGSVGEYVQTLKKAAGEKPVNVIVSDEGSRVQIPSISLREVTVFTALSALGSAFATNSQHGFVIDTVGTGDDATFAILYVPNGSRPSDPFKQSGGRRLEVYSIRDLIEPPASASGSSQAKVEYESILSAVESAMTMFEEANPPKLMYHKETGLLMVGGTQYQTEVVSSLINRIRDDLQRRWAEERTSKKQSMEQQRRVSVARSELMLAEKELQLAAEQSDRVQKLKDAGTVPLEEARQAELNVDRARAMVERRKIDLDGALQAESSGAKMIVIYDITDLTARDPSVMPTLMSLSGRLGVSVEWKDGRLVASGDEAAHESLKDLLSTIRKVAVGAGTKR